MRRVQAIRRDVKRLDAPVSVPLEDAVSPEQGSRYIPTEVTRECSISYAKRKGRRTRVSRNNGVNDMCTYAGRRDATRRVVSRRVASCRVAAANGQTAALREITSHARNDHETVTPVPVLPPVIPPGHQGPDVLLPAHLRTSVSHLSPSYPAPTADRSPPRVHVSGRPTITLPAEHRRDTQRRAPRLRLFSRWRLSLARIQDIPKPANVFLIMQMFFLWPISERAFSNRDMSRRSFIAFFSIFVYLYN